MARDRRPKKASSYRSKQYFRGVKSSADDGRRPRKAATKNGFFGSVGQRIGGFLILAVILGGCLLLGYVDSAKVSINGPSPYETEAIDTRVQAYLDSNPLRRLKPFITSAGLLDYVKQTHPDVAVSTVTISVFSPTIEVDIQMRSPAMIWVNGDDTRAVVDVNGVLYADYDQQYHSDLLIEISDATQPGPELSAQVLSPQLISFIQNIDVEVAAQTELKSHKFELPLAARELRLKLPDYDIRFSLDRFEQEQVQELKLLLLDLKKKKIIPQEYIDLRAEDRAFYK
ncbi:MAG: hypothetical protein R3313_02075 [Candidatus Saccharimonadales bacterium]|nr:hypothetical protein [Candidatus Saccharimonadales bacterium]